MTSVMLGIRTVRQPGPGRWALATKWTWRRSSTIPDYLDAAEAVLRRIEPFDGVAIIIRRVEL